MSLTVFTCRSCEIASIQTGQTGLEYVCPVHGLLFQTKAVPFRGYHAGCPVCEAAKDALTRPFVRHDNCTSPGATGHGRKGHCTADGCF